MHHDSFASLFDTNECHFPHHLATLIHYSKIIPLLFVVHVFYATLYVVFHSFCSFCVAFYNCCFCEIIFTIMFLHVFHASKITYVKLVSMKFFVFLCIFLASKITSTKLLSLWSYLCNYVFLHSSHLKDCFYKVFFSLKSFMCTMFINTLQAWTKSFEFCETCVLFLIFVKFVIIVLCSFCLIIIHFLKGHHLNWRQWKNCCFCWFSCVLG